MSLSLLESQNIQNSLNINSSNSLGISTGQFSPSDGVIILQPNTSTIFSTQNLTINYSIPTYQLAFYFLNMIYNSNNLLTAGDSLSISCKLILPNGYYILPPYNNLTLLTSATLFNGKFETIQNINSYSTGQFSFEISLTYNTTGTTPLMLQYATRPNTGGCLIPLLT